MKDIIAALIMLGALVAAWYWIANKFRQKGSGAITRHFAGFVCGIGALFVAGIVVAAMGLIDSESTSTGPQAADKAAGDRDLTQLYSIASDETNAPYKRSVEVTLHQRVSKDDLESIGRSIKKMGDKDVERTFIGYRLESQNPESAYWGATHYNPELSVDISGLTPSQLQAYQSYDPSEHYQDPIGSWRIERGFNYIAVAYQKNDEVFIDDVFPGDGVNTSRYVTSQAEGGGLRLQKPDDTFGEYFVITQKGDLQFWSDNGNYYTAEPRNPDAVDIKI
ncbi:hypothetical protein [Chromohalobacter nigrandesensis]|uniref:hypothetical protein n=1 Tax=Chromohalobacter nigrandesensis TaxID=119863 RepID=UPI001FF3EF20|nr:hypothetical protein [Chromohalobacter nigrandesensis]MCK0744132.1 hypothetical protein [Chromohalobacter nigrandesensis]